MLNVDELILNHREYVRKLAREIQRKLPNHASFDDMVGFGEVGLVEAANSFDPHAGVAFTTFAFYRIRGAIFDGIGKMTGLTPALRRQVNQEAGMDQVAQDAAAPAETSQDPEVLARSFGDAVKRLGAVFLASNLSDDEKPLDSADHGTPDQLIEQAEMVAKLKEAVAKLSPELLQIITLFYFEQKSMSEIGAVIGKDKATVSRRHAKAIEALAAALGP
jgi:RNA polymerase sigma factor for flagellar operon FliA